MTSAELDLTCCLVLPCFNEADRLRGVELQRLLEDRRIRLVLVDDGSVDSTLGLLRTFESSSAVDVVVLPHNVGKGEAVRRGLILGLSLDPDWLGYVDADMSTPADEVVRLLDLACQRGRISTLCSGRGCALIGRHLRVRRSATTPGAFATFASQVLQLPAYDTQCGAKLFRRTAALDAAVGAPFRSRWAFDVELIGRLLRGGTPTDRLWEEPLHTWTDIGGSRRSVSASVIATLSLVAVRRDLTRWRPRPD